MKKSRFANEQIAFALKQAATVSFVLPAISFEFYFDDATVCRPVAEYFDQTMSSTGGL